MDGEQLATREHLHRAIEHDKQDLALALSDLRAAAQYRFELGRQVAAHPAAFAFGAFAVGFWLGFRHRR